MRLVLVSGVSISLRNQLVHVAKAFLPGPQMNP